MIDKAMSDDDRFDGFVTVLLKLDQPQVFERINLEDGFACT